MELSSSRRKKSTRIFVGGPDPKSAIGSSGHARSVSGVVHQSASGRLDTLLRWGREVRPGDIVLIDYVGFSDLPRPWDHVGVLARDDGDGSLDADDVLYHMGLETGLTVEPLRAQGAVRLQLLRLRDRYRLGS